MENYHLYIITNLINDKKYIGISRIGYLNRWKYHKETYTNEKRPREYNSIFYRALRKYNPENFKIEFLKEGDSWEHLCELEIAAIQEYNTYFKNNLGYNMTLGGDGVHGYTWKWTEEQLARRPKHVIGAQGMKNIQESKFGSKNPNARRVIIEGIEYGAATEAVKDLEISIDLIRVRLSDNRFPEYYHVDDDKNAKISLFGADNPKSKPVIVFGHKYVSMTEASRTLEISIDVLRNRLLNKKYLDYDFL